MADIKEKPKLLFREEIDFQKGDIIPQPNFQENVLLSNANLSIIGGSRGAGKSYSLVLDPLYDTESTHFSAMYIRKETSEVEKGLYQEASKVFPLLGAKMTKLRAVFPSGAIITFDHLQNESITDIERRFKGLSIPAFYIDELDQIKFDTLKRIMESNRNSYGIRNRIIATCNPAPGTWLRTFLDWYIDDMGFIDPERNGKMRYFYIYGTDVNDIIWGNDKDEVLERAENYISSAWDDAFYDAGLTKYDMIKSLIFIRGELSENKILLKSDPNYLSSVSQGGASAIARNLKGNWNVLEDGQELVNRQQMDYMFDEDRTALRTGIKYMSIDVALLGLDNFVAIIWDGMHIEDVRVKEKMDSSEAVDFVTTLMSEYGIREDNVCYDNIGNGQALTCFKRAIPINAQAAPIGTEVSYDNLKSQIMYNFGKYVIEGKITCNPNVTNRLYPYGRGGKKNKLSFKEILHNERRALMLAESTGKTRMLNKKDMKKILGQSPDFMEAVAYKIIFELDKKKKQGFLGLQYL